MARLDVAMFNAILRESADEIPTDPVSDPISDSKVLPIPAGKSSFGAGAQLKNAVSDTNFRFWPKFNARLSNIMVHRSGFSHLFVKISFPCDLSLLFLCNVV